MSKLSLNASPDVTPATPPSQRVAASFLRLETAHGLCRLGGDVRNEVHLFGVTAPEVILLRHIHGGSDTVYKLEVVGESRMTATGERIRLLKKYPRHEKLIAELFPGLAPNFPLTIAEAEEIASLDLQEAEREMDGVEPDTSANPME